LRFYLFFLLWNHSLVHRQSRHSLTINRLMHIEQHIPKYLVSIYVFLRILSQGGEVECRKLLSDVGS
jgi:hypothetical protein